MAAVCTDVWFVVNFMLLFFLPLLLSVSCNGCRKTIRRNQTSEKCFTCRNIFHLQCLNDKWVGDEERFYCSGCCPAEPEYMFNTFDPLLSGFINKKGFKILHQNVNGIYKKLDQIKTFLSDSKNSIHVVGFSETHTNSTVSDAELDIQGYSFERLIVQMEATAAFLCIFAMIYGIREERI